MRCRRCHDVMMPSAPGCDRCGHLSDDAFARAVEASSGPRRTWRARALGWAVLALVPVGLVPLAFFAWWSWFGRPPNRWPRLIDLPLELILIGLTGATVILASRARDALERARLRQHLPPRPLASTAPRVPVPRAEVERR